MLNKGLRSIAVVALAVSLVLTGPCADVFAQPRGGPGHGGGRGGGPGHGGGYYGWGGGAPRHYYNNGHWYRRGWLGFDIFVGALALGALVDALPPRCTTVVVAGAPYYYYDGYYYRPYPAGGYVVVAPPVFAQPVEVVQPVAPVVAVPTPVYTAAPAPAPAAPAAAAIAQAQPQSQGPESITVNIPNARGGYTAVTLKKSGTGYLGPQGEWYSENPTVEQLKVLYGK